VLQPGARKALVPAFRCVHVRFILCRHKPSGWQLNALHWMPGAAPSLLTAWTARSVCSGLHSYRQLQASPSHCLPAPPCVRLFHPCLPVRVVVVVVVVVVALR
jgi:hypothetical protein